MRYLEYDDQKHIGQFTAAKEGIAHPGIMTDRPQRIAGSHAAFEPLPIHGICETIAACRLLNRDGRRYLPAKLKQLGHRLARRDEICRFPSLRRCRATSKRHCEKCREQYRPHNTRVEPGAKRVGVE